MQDFVSTYLSDKYPMRHKRDLIFYGEEIPRETPVVVFISQ